MRKNSALGFSLVLIGLLSIISHGSKASAEGNPVNTVTANGTVYLKDFTKVTPQDAISLTPVLNKWHLTQMGGETVLYADASGPTEPVTYPLDLKGWYDIYVGIVERPYNVDDADWQGIHIRLTGDKWYTQICGGRTGLGYEADLAVVDEFFWKRANLTDQNIIIYQPYGRFFKPRAGVAYIKLVPKSDKQVEKESKDAEKRISSSGPKKIGGMADWWSLVFVKKNVEADVTRKMVTDHKNAGFDTIYFQINAAGVVHYPSKVSQMLYYDPVEDPRPDATIVGEMLSKHDPLKVVTEESHKQGLKLFAWFRVTNEHFMDNPNSEYAMKFRHLRIVGADGQQTRWPSLTHKEIQDYKLAILKEVVTNYQVDGLMLDYLRTMPVIGYEPHVVKAYVDKYGVDPLKVPSERSNMRWKKFRAEYLTNFMREVKKIATEEEKRSGRRIQIAARVTPKDNLWKGMDVETWIKEGLIDIVIPSNYSHYDPFISIESFKKMVKGTKCKVYPCINPFFAGGDDYGEYHPNAAEKDVAEIISRRMTESPTPMEFAERAMQFYAEGAEGLIFYESESIAADPPMYPGRPGMNEMFRTLRNTKELQAYIESQEK